MHLLKFIVFLTQTLLFIPFNHHPTKYTSNKVKALESPITKTEATILLQPFTGFPNAELIYISEQIKKIYPKVIIKNPIDLPQNAFNQVRKRYRADSIISYLSKQTKYGFLTIGLTTKDISTTKGKNLDWGIMGLGLCPGKSCIVSSFRIKGKNRLEKVFKVAIHELGHTQGLKHCPISTCLMRDAEGKDKLNEEKEFCPKCKKVLIKAGWGIK
jgi:archaemetzincin